MKKKILSIIATAVIAGSLVGCGANSVSAKDSEEAQENETSSEVNTIRIGIQPGDLLNNVAFAKGFFDEEGINVDAQVFSYGPPIIEALTSGDLDVGLMGDQPAFSAISNDVDIEIISAISSSNKRHGLLARDDSGIDSLEDLKGKTVSVPVGSNAQPLLYIYLDSAGLTEDDVEIVNLGVVDAETSIIAGDIDAAVVYEPHFTSVATEENGVHVVTNAEGYKDYVSISVGRTDYGKEHAEDVAKLFSAWEKAAKWAEENPEEAAQIVYDADGTSTDVTINYINNSELGVNLTDSDVKALVDGEQQSYQFGLIQNDFDVNDYINFEYLELAGLH
ncbi:MAG: aliphatic sulfonate ABC transporter substrate-binding protein [Pseudobutyrivibrio sp.]|nr:aliphatic sulfonate ABC transporter substrate-binding protein [Pseudobutyrivibrio sp.]